MKFKWTMVLLTTITAFAFPASGQEKDALSRGTFQVRGFPAGEEVLSRKTVNLPQPDPILEFKANGFRGELLSKVPSPGVHPRVFMSPEDIVRIRENITSNTLAKKAWNDVLVKRIKPDQPPKGTGDEGLYALVTQNEEYGKKAAAALVEKAKEVEKKVDDINAKHPYADNWWVGGMRGSGIMDVADAYDYLYNFMTDDQRSLVRKVVSKATVGHYTHGMELPRSWRTWNWPFFSQDIVCAALAIEGEDGYEPRIYDIIKDSVMDFFTYSISPEGYATEGTSYWHNMVWNGGGTTSLIAVARRLRDPSPLTHPHLQKYASSLLAIMGGPDGPWFGRGDASGGHPGFPLVHIMHYFYPEDPRWDLLWQSCYQQSHWDGSPGRTCCNGILFPYLIFPAEPMKDADGKSVNWWTKDAKLPLSYSTSLGHFAARSSWDPESSLQMTFSAITELTNPGHDGPDEGTFSVWANGIDWSRGVDKWTKRTPWRASIAIDGKGQYYGASHGLFVETSQQPEGAAGLVDVTYSYTWSIAHGLSTPLYSPLFDEMPGFYTWDWTMGSVLKYVRNEELDPHPFSREFWKFAGTNYGLWNGEKRYPGGRGLQTPVERAFRSVSLIRGSHPYVMVVDDIQKDDQQHLYDWIMPLAGRNEVIRKTDETDKNTVEILIRRLPKTEKGKLPPALKQGDPLLLVRVLNRNSEAYPSIRFVDENPNRDGSQRIIVPSLSVSPGFKILIYPHRHGDPLPATIWNDAGTRLNVEIGDQIDTFRFANAYVDRRPFGGYGEQTYYNVFRNEQKILSLEGPPSLPIFNEPSREFDREMACSFAKPASGQEIRYTLDGSDPNEKSFLFDRPIKIDKTVTVKAATFAPYWEYGEKRSGTVEATYTSTSLLAPDAHQTDLVPGVKLSVYELPVSIWKGAHVDLESPLMPDFEKEPPIFVTHQKDFSLPRVKPIGDMRKMHQGFYRFETYFNAPAKGRYIFKMNSCGPTSLKIGDKVLIDVKGPYFTMLRDREGEVFLEPGLHRMTVVAADPVFFVSDQRNLVPFSLQVSVPDIGKWQDVSSDMLFREKSFSFSIATSMLEADEFLIISTEVPGAEVHYTLDGTRPDASSPLYTKPFQFEKPQSVMINAVLYKDGKAISPVISKNVNVIAKVKSLKDVPFLASGMLRSRFLKEKDPDKKDLPASFFDNQGLQAEDVMAVDDFLLDAKGGIIKSYKAYWQAPETGLYEFNLPFDGINQLIIDGVPVSGNHYEGAVPNGKIILENGWHHLIMNYEASVPGIRVISSGKERILNSADFKRPAHIKDIPFAIDKLGKPASFMLGAWALPGQECQDIRLKSEIFGAKPDEGSDRPGALRMSGIKSMILLKGLRQTSEGLTFSAWIKPDTVKGEQMLFNRQKPVDNVYAQRGGFYFQLVNDQLELLGYGFFERSRSGRIQEGVWHHIAATVQLNRPAGYTVFEIFLNGKRIDRRLYPHILDVSCDYMELFGQAERQKTSKENTGGLGYDQLSIVKSFKGEIADVRLYDTTLSQQIISKLAE